jgi:hypothetical protein
MIRKWKNSYQPSWTWITIAILLILFFGLGTLLIPNKQTDYPEFISQSPSPTGVKAIYTFIKNQQTQVQVWERPVEQLPSSSEQFMLLIEPNQMFNEEEQAKWIEWMEHGNDLWLVAHYPEGFFDAKTNKVGSNNESPIKQIHTNEGTYKALVETNLRLVPKAGDETIFEDSSGPIAISRTYGKGELTVLLTPEWFQNKNILENDHLQLILPLLEHVKPEVVWFNDYIHGFKSKLAIIEAYPEWFIVIFTQICLFMLLFIWSEGKRFGPVETPREWVVRFGDERIRAQAVWYQKGEFYQETLHHQMAYLRLIIQDQWGIATNTVSQDFIDLTKRRLPQSKQSQWEQNWLEINAISSTGKVSHKQFLRCSKLIDDMRKEVQE